MFRERTMCPLRLRQTPDDPPGSRSSCLDHSGLLNAYAAVGGELSMSPTTPRPSRVVAMASWTGLAMGQKIAHTAHNLTRKSAARCRPAGEPCRRRPGRGRELATRPTNERLPSSAQRTGILLCEADSHRGNPMLPVRRESAATRSLSRVTAPPIPTSSRPTPGPPLPPPEPGPEPWPEPGPPAPPPEPGPEPWPEPGPPPPPPEPGPEPWPEPGPEPWPEPDPEPSPEPEPATNPGGGRSLVPGRQGVPRSLRRSRSQRAVQARRRGAEGPAGSDPPAMAEAQASHKH